jgi:VIT1/CCC1 family predicted Fe2+/Mn2+ transporter
MGFLALLGAIGAKTGGASILRATARVTFWGALAMALTAGYLTAVTAQEIQSRSLEAFAARQVSFL